MILDIDQNNNELMNEVTQISHDLDLLEDEKIFKYVSIESPSKFINNNIDCFIISNDNFNDHINIFKNFIFDFNFKNIFKQYIINYTINPLKINDIIKIGSTVFVV